MYQEPEAHVVKKKRLIAEIGKELAADRGAIARYDKASWNGIVIEWKFR